MPSTTSLAREITAGYRTWPRYRLFGLTLASDFPFANQLIQSPSSESTRGGSATLTPASGDPDLVFTCVPQPPIRPGWDQATPAYSSPYRDAGGESIAHLYRLGACDVLRFTGVADFYLWPDRIVCHVADPSHNSLVEIRLLGAVLSLWLERRGILVLHASAIVVEDRAIAFASDNQGGKSALAATFMQAGFPLLTDDVLPLEFRAGMVVGRPGYPQMRLWPEEARHFLGHWQNLAIVHPGYAKRRVPVGPDGLGTFCDEARPLACVYLPERVDSARATTPVEITPVTARDALMGLIGQSLVARVTEALGLHRRRFDFFARMVRQVPVRRLAYPSGFEHLPRVRDAILADLKDNEV